MNLTFDVRAVVTAAIERGWVKPPAQPLGALSSNQIRRVRFAAQGLTSRGTVPKRKCRPELEGLKPQSAAYQVAWRRMRKAERKANQC
jgi:hypothetical protein